MEYRHEKRLLEDCNVWNSSTDLKASNKLSQRDTGDDVKMQRDYNISKDC